MQIYADEAYRLEALGLGDDVSPLVLRAFCQRCDQLLHTRRYTALVSDATVVAEAEQDAAAALAHRCLVP